MAPLNLITSLHNPKIKEALHLRDRKKRDETDLFLIEGYRELLRATDSQRAIKWLFYCPAFFLGKNEPALIERIVQKGAELFPCNEKVFQKLSYRDRPDGLLAVAPQKHLALSDLELLLSKTKNPFLVVAEAIEKPGNLGTILRSSDASGVQGVIVADRCTDIHNPNVVRSSVGTLFTVPVVEAKGSDALNFLKRQHILIVAATPQAEKEYTKTDLTKPLAIVVGTEQLGLSKNWLEAADIQVRIPMLGVADSLNVATATTLLLYEVLRQRTCS